MMEVPITALFVPSSPRKGFIDLRRILNYYSKVIQLIPNTYEYPFGEGKYQIKKTKLPKRVLSNEEIKKVADLIEFDSPEQEYARDIWLLCYRYNGSNYVDMLRLKWEDVKNENVIFYRKKTETTQRINKKPVNVPLNDGSQALLDKVGDKNSIFVLGLLEEGYSEKTITNKSNKNRRDLNLHLKSIEKRLKLSASLRLETARDCYASCLNRAGVPTKFISELMVHSSVNVTENYLSGMNNKEIFDANNFLY